MSQPAFTTAAVAKLLGAELVGPGDISLSSFDTLDRADRGGLTFIRDDKFAAGWGKSRASAAIVTRGVSVPEHDPATRALLVVQNADHALSVLLGHLASIVAVVSPPGRHPTAQIDATAQIAPTASIGPLCTIGAGAVIGENTVLVARVHIGAGARIGAAGLLHPGVTILDRCVIGARAIIHAGVVIGADGFGFLPSPDGRGVMKIPHVGNVEIGDDVEIGANSCIDRAKMGSTRIGSGTKLDNMVQIGHGVQIGRHCLIAAQVGIAGSVVVEDGVRMGGQVGIGDALRIGAGAMLAGKAGVMRSVPAGETWFGYPAKLATTKMREELVVERMTTGRSRVRRAPADRKNSRP